MKKHFENIKTAYFIIPKKYRTQVKRSLVFTLFNGFLDVFSLAALIPVILISLNPAQIRENDLISKIYDQLGFTSDAIFLVSILIGLVMLFILKNFINTLVNYYQTKTAFDIATELSMKIFHSFFNLPYLEFTKSNSAIISRKINTIPHNFAVYILTSHINLITEVIIGSIIITAIGIYNPIICLLLIAATLPVLVMWRWFKKQHIDRVEIDFREKFPINLKNLMQGIDSYIDVKLHQKESFFIDNFIRIKREMNTNYAYLKTAQLLPPKILEVVMIMSITLIFAYASFIQTDLELVPILSLFVAGFYRLYPSVTKIATAKTAILTYDYVLEELNSLQHKSNPSTEHQISFGHKVRFDNISYGYPDKGQLFNNLTLQINKGQCIGIRGESGSGKTTLVKILIGLIRPDQGEIWVDDIPLSENCSNSWLTKIGYLQQQPVIIDASIEENIAFGERVIDKDKLAEVINKTNLVNFIAALPQGSNTIVGENGLQISGGQSQRIALARALYRDSELLIFDEISNNLDDANLLEIRDTIRNLSLSGKTILLIDHNPILLELTDKIWLVSDRKVEETEGKIVKP